MSTLCPTPITNRGATQSFSPGGCGMTRGNVPKPPATPSFSLVQTLLFFFLYSLSLSLSLPPPFSHCHSANDDGHGSRPARRRRRTSQRPFRAWHIQCVRAACVGSLRGTSFDLERGCVSGCFPLLNAVRIPRKPPSSHLDSISWIDAATNLGGEGKGLRALKSPHASDHPLVRQKKST